MLFAHFGKIHDELQGLGSPRGFHNILMAHTLHNIHHIQDAHFQVLMQ